MNKKIRYAVFIISLLLMPVTTYASKGCCSHHGGISHCGTNNYYICEDGTQSPTCVCEEIELTDTSNNSDNTCDCETETSDLNYKITSLENQLSNYKVLFWGTIILIVINYIVKNKDNKTK